MGLKRTLSRMVLSSGLVVCSAFQLSAGVRAPVEVYGLAVPLSLQKGGRAHTPVKRTTSARETPRSPQRLRKPDVIYYPTPAATVLEMLRLAQITSEDLLYDLGSGDGRIPIMAAQLYGARAVGIEINPKLVWVAEERARGAGVSDRVSFINMDMFRADFRKASVVTLYLSRKLNLLLLPKLLRELRPGSRIISHDFDMGDWQPEQTVRVPWQNGHRTVYVWTVPARNKITR